MGAPTDKPGNQSSLSFGWFSFRPRCLQILNTPKWFLFFLSQYFFTQSVVVNGIFPGSISTIERRFGLTSSMTGLLTSSLDISATILTPIVSYLGGSRKKPVFCGFGLFTIALGLFVFLLPHVISDEYRVDEVLVNVSGVTLCAANQTSSMTPLCNEESATGNTAYYSLFLLGMLIVGVGVTPMYALGIPYMDENVKPKVAPMYVGIFMASGILGSLIGFVLLSIFLSIYVDLGVQTSLTPRDPRWVGAWWLGFAIFGALCAFWSFWLFGFPKEFPSTRARRERKKEAVKDKVLHEEHGYSKLSDILKATKLVFSRPPYVTITLGGCMEAFYISMGVAFMSKILQSKFRMLPGSAALLFGSTNVPAAFLGNLLGAYISKRLNLDIRGSARMCFIVGILGFLCSCLLYINCGHDEIVGVNQPYFNSSSRDNLASWCNRECDCSGVAYSPVCAGERTFFSACHAGCSVTNAAKKSYANCSCVVAKSEAWGEVHSGACDVSCRLQLVLFVALCSLIICLTFVNDTPAFIVTLRSVPVAQRSYALGLQMDLVRVLGAIPGPIVMGRLIDKSCILWNTSCGSRTSCLEYNNAQLTASLLCVVAVCKFITTSSFFVTWLLCRKQRYDTECEIIEL